MNSGGSISTYLIGPGATLQVPCSGTQFYIVACPGFVLANAGQGFAPYYMGTGLDVGKAFTLLQIKNPGSSQTIVQIFIGTSGYVDHRLIPASALVNVQVSEEFQPQNQEWGAAAMIPDYSSQIITNPNDGLNYYAVSRQSLTIINASQDLSFNGQPMRLQIGPTFLNSRNMAVLPSLAVTGSNPMNPNVALPPFQVGAISGNFWIGAYNATAVANWNVFVTQVFRCIIASDLTG